MSVVHCSIETNKRIAKVWEFMLALDAKLGPAKELTLKATWQRTPTAVVAEEIQRVIPALISIAEIESLRYEDIKIVSSVKSGTEGFFCRAFNEKLDYAKWWSKESMARVEIHPSRINEYSFELYYYRKRESQQDPEPKPFVMGLVWDGPPNVDSFKVSDFDPNHLYWGTHS